MGIVFCKKEECNCCNREGQCVDQYTLKKYEDSYATFLDDCRNFNKVHDDLDYDY